MECNQKNYKSALESLKEILETIKPYLPLIPKYVPKPKREWKLDDGALPFPSPRGKSLADVI